MHKYKIISIIKISKIVKKAKLKRNYLSKISYLILAKILTAPLYNLCILLVTLSFQDDIKNISSGY